MQAGRGWTTYGQQPLLRRNAAGFWPTPSFYNHYLCDAYFQWTSEGYLNSLLHIFIVGRFGIKH